MSVPAILIVEDNLDEIELLREAVCESLAGVVVTIMGTVESALAWLAIQPDERLPVLVLTDHHLPDCLGHDLIAALRACPRSCRLPVVMVSGDACRPPGLGEIAWYGKPDTWKGWQVLARELVERHVMKATKVAEA